MTCPHCEPHDICSACKDKQSDVIQPSKSEMKRIAIQKRLYLGIDPGLSGALALYDSAKRFPVALIDMPIIKATKTTHAKVDVHETAAFIQRHKKLIKIAIVEDFWPGKFPNAAFNLGVALGSLLGILEGLDIPFRKARGCDWKKTFKLGKDKTQSRKMAIELFPAHSDLFLRVKDDGRAEALLLAVYGHMRDCLEESFTS